MRLRIYCVACGTVGGTSGLVAGIWLGSSSCGESAWWNPFAALRAVRSAAQNPLLRAFAPQSVEWLHLASAGILSTAVGGAGVMARIGVGVISSEERWSLGMLKRALKGEMDSNKEERIAEKREKGTRNDDKSYLREDILRELLDLRGGSRDEQTREAFLGTRVEEVEEVHREELGRPLRGSSAGLQLGDRTLVPTPGRRGRAAAVDGAFSIPFHHRHEEDVYKRGGLVSASHRRNPYTSRHYSDYVPGDDRRGPLHVGSPTYLTICDRTSAHVGGSVVKVGHVDAFGGRWPDSAVPMRRRLQTM